MRTYSDNQLARAVAESHSWRGVLRLLGLRATSGSAVRSVRRQAELLNLDYRHFTGQRRWSDQQLADAVARSRSWTAVLEMLGLAGGSSNAKIRSHALRLGLDTRHIGHTPAVHETSAAAPQPQYLRRAGALLAAAWFELTGAKVAWPLEPCRYDLVVIVNGGSRRVQVKTTTSRFATTWRASLRCTGRRERTYDPDDIDDFFIIDGDLNMYLIPIDAVAGLTAIQMSGYTEFQLSPLAFGEPSQASERDR